MYNQEEGRDTKGKRSKLWGFSDENGGRGVFITRFARRLCCGRRGATLYSNISKHKKTVTKGSKGYIVRG